ncbi:MAG: RNA polymerase sigma factor [Chthonomonadaceae bacterium]|nr:RNA polymerase sigma factor [Chthonomonadaceae bacterium]
MQSSNPSSTPESDLKMQVEQMLSSLTPSLRAAFLLREVESLDYAEIADTLQIPVGTVRSRLSAAREQFRLLWEKAEEETRHV